MPASAVSRTIRAVFWDLHSRTWDGGAAPAALAVRTAEILAWVQTYAGPGARVLDVGCATGTHALALSTAGYHVTGLDISSGMLARARAKARQVAAATAAVGSVHFARCDLEQTLPPASGTYAVALCAGVLQCAEVPVGFLAAIHRALHPDGVVLVEVKDSASAVPPANGHSLASRVVAPLKRWASRSRAVHVFTRDRLEADLRAAGLRIVDDLSGPGWLRVAARAAQR